MKTVFTLFATAAILTGLGFAAPVLAQTATPMATQKVMLTAVDPTMLTTGWRATEIIGAPVYDDAGDEIGTLQDMIITANGTVPYAVVSVGGFLGMAAHHVVVTAGSLELMDKKLTLHGASKDSLKAMPNFEFPS